MSCYICLEDQGKLMSVKGCYCKGGLEVHLGCLRKWLSNAENPFKCSVCKGDYSGTFMTRFMTKEEILFHSNGTEEDDSYDDEEGGEDLYMDGSSFYVYNGIPIMNADGMLCFETEKDKTIYIEMTNKEDKSVKQDLRARNKKVARIHVKLHRQPKWSKRIPFRK